MANVNVIKGLQSVRTMGTVKSNSNPDKNSDFLKLYMIEKERARLCKEKDRILIRLESIEANLKDIEKLYSEKTELIKVSLGSGRNISKRSSGKTKEGKTKWKTMSIDY
jgi:hypothetical protein